MFRHRSETWYDKFVKSREIFWKKTIVWNKGTFLSMTFIWVFSCWVSRSPWKTSKSPYSQFTSTKTTDSKGNYMRCNMLRLHLNAMLQFTGKECLSTNEILDARWNDSAFQVCFIYFRNYKSIEIVYWIPGIWNISQFFKKNVYLVQMRFQDLLYSTISCCF